MEKKSRDAWETWMIPMSAKINDKTEDTILSPAGFSFPKQAIQKKKK